MRSGSNRPRWLAIAFLTALLLAGAAAAEVLMTKEEALTNAFPDAERVDKQILYFSDAEQQRVAKLARVPMDSGLFTVYKAFKGGQVAAYGFIDTRTIRSKPATFLVVLEPDGKVRSSRVLAWKEPPEYLPPGRWLAQFAGHGLEPHTRLGGEITAMSGASYTSSTLTDGIRRILAVHRVKLAGGG